MFLIGLLVAFLTDLVTKLVAQNTIQGPISIIGDVLQFRLLKNDGIAFGLDIPYLGYITAILIVFLFWYYYKFEYKSATPLGHFAFGLILGGALGNAWERILFEEVTDFIAVKGFSVLNIADIAINVGVILLIISYIRKGK